jgi:hypothetical protein
LQIALRCGGVAGESVDLQGHDHDRTHLARTGSGREERRLSQAHADLRHPALQGGAYALLRVEGDVAHFDMLTFWESLEAIKAFAGDDVEKARYDDFDKDYLLEYEPNCRHYEVFER